MPFFAEASSVRFFAEILSVRPSGGAFPCVVRKLMFSCSLLQAFFP